MGAAPAAPTCVHQVGSSAGKACLAAMQQHDKGCLATMQQHDKGCLATMQQRWQGVLGDHAGVLACDTARMSTAAPSATRLAGWVNSANSGRPTAARPCGEAAGRVQSRCRPAPRQVQASCRPAAAPHRPRLTRRPCALLHMPHHPWGRIQAQAWACKQLTPHLQHSLEEAGLCAARPGVGGQRPNRLHRRHDQQRAYKQQRPPSMVKPWSVGMFTAWL
jgi:hypothetical protein